MLRIREHDRPRLQRRRGPSQPRPAPSDCPERHSPAEFALAGLPRGDSARAAADSPSIARAAKPASSTADAWSSSLNDRPPAFSVRYKLATATRSTRIGTPRNETHPRMPRRHAVTVRVLAQIGHTQRNRIEDQIAEHTLAARPLADPRARTATAPARPEDPFSTSPRACG
jgi:hypothetical protein